MQVIESKCDTNYQSKSARYFPSLLFWQSTVMLLLVFYALSAQAQFRTSIQGVVTDPQGALIPDATLTLTNQSTNQTVVRTSNEAGVFNFNALPADRFNLVIEKQGFKKKLLNDLQLIPEQPNSLNVQMELGATAETVTVNAALAPLIDTQTAASGTTISSNEIEHMPSFGRDVFQLTQLAPGVVSDGARSGSGDTFNNPGNQGPGGTTSSTGIFGIENGPQANSNGGQYETNSITVDGISTVSAVWGGTTVITPNEDSIGNVRIVTNSYDAENDRFSGAQTKITSKSGTNEYHGSLFFAAHRPGLNAYQRYNGPGFYASGATTPAEKGLLRNSDRFNQFGGSVGAPFWKNKLFGFFAYETIRSNSSLTGTGWYDTADFDGLAPSGSIASQYLTFAGAGVKSTGIINVTCAEIGLVEGVTCNTISGKGLNIGSPMAGTLGTQDLGWVNATTPGVGGGLSTVADIADYATVNPTTKVEAQYNGRLDAEITAKDHATFAIYWVPQTVTNYNGGARTYNVFHHESINDAFTLVWNHTFSPTLLNEARANAGGWRYNEIASNPQAPVGLPQASVSAIGSPSISLNQFGSALGSDLNQWTFGYKDVATKIAGRHTIKFGGELTRLHYLNNPVGRPTYTFFNVWDFLNDAPKQEQGSFDTVTGLPGGSRADNRENILGFFVQDDFKLTPNLTINMGLRYQYFGSLYSKQNNLSVVEFGTGSDYLTGINMRQGGHLWTPQKGNFGPQFGFNWVPPMLNSKLVVRGGYGLNYNQEEIAISANSNFNPPGTGYYNFNSNTPDSINANILYGISSSATSLYGFASNPNTITSYNSNHLPVAGSASVTAFPSHLPTAYSHHFSLQTEYDLGHQFVASLGYEGSTSRHLISQYLANAVAALQGVALNPLVTNVQVFGNGESSNNNMMMASLKHQYSQHFSAEAQFTWARSMDFNSGPYQIDPYPNNPYYAYGRSDFDIGKSFKLFGVWQPVIFRGDLNWLEKAVGGWTVSGIMNIHSGFGWTPTYSTSTLYYNGSWYGTLRPNYKGGGGHSTSNDAFKSGPGVGNGKNKNFPDILTDVVTGTASYSNKYFEMQDYSAALAGSSFPGTSAGAAPVPGLARNSFAGPGYKNVDLSLSKGFGLPKFPVLGENAKLEIRADAFNLFNFLNFSPSSVSNNITASNFGQASTALGARTIDMQVRFSF